jgi:hypothetical protein
LSGLADPVRGDCVLFGDVPASWSRTGLDHLRGQRGEAEQAASGTVDVSTVVDVQDLYLVPALIDGIAHAVLAAASLPLPCERLA